MNDIITVIEVDNRDNVIENDMTINEFLSMIDDFIDTDVQLAFDDFIFFDDVITHDNIDELVEELQSV